MNASPVSSVVGQQATQPGERAAVRSLGTRSKLLGAVGMLSLAQMFMFLIGEEGSPLLPGFSEFDVGMTIYLILMAVIVVPFIGLSPRIGTSRAYIGLETGAPITRFLRDYAVVGLLGWGLLSAVGFALGGSVGMLPAAERLNLLVFEAFFVSVTEELVFRVALPLHINWFVASALLFAFFHLAVDSITIGLADPAALASAFFQRMGAGVLLWYLYSRVGLAAAVASHATYDEFISGGLPALGLAHMHALGLVPV